MIWFYVFATTFAKKSIMFEIVILFIENYVIFNYDENLCNY